MNQTTALEKQIEDSRKLVSLRDDAIALSENQLFRRLILDEFCVKEAARMVGLSADPSLDAGQRADALNMAQAAGHLRRWLSMTVTMGNTAAREIPNIEEALEEVRTEEGAD